MIFSMEDNTLLMHLRVEYFQILKSIPSNINNYFDRTLTSEPQSTPLIKTTPKTNDSEITNTVCTEKSREKF